MLGLVGALVTAAVTLGAEAAPDAVKQVDPKTVCMVNDAAMGKPQIPIVIEEKTYYGCCDMCKQRLAQDEAVRFAVDPVTGEKVDKARAVIGERPDGSVLYFASAETFESYAKRE
jgi:YHS domain-containing protein